MILVPKSQHSSSTCFSKLRFFSNGFSNFGFLHFCKIALCKILHVLIGLRLWAYMFFFRIKLWTLLHFQEIEFYKIGFSQIGWNAMSLDRLRIKLWELFSDTQIFYKLCCSSDSFCQKYFYSDHNFENALKIILRNWMYLCST